MNTIEIKVVDNGYVLARMTLDVTNEAEPCKIHGTAVYTNFDDLVLAVYNALDTEVSEEFMKFVRGKSIPLDDRI